jgi:AAA domain-containing protein
MTDDLFKRTGAGDFSKFLKVMVSGPPKSGKTTLLGTVPNLLVLDTEPQANNLDSIAHLDIPFVTITNSDDLRQVAMILGNASLRQQMAQAKYNLPDIGAVAIDTLDTLQKILKAERLKEQRSTQFLRDDWGWLKTEMEEIIQMFTALPMHVFFMVHTKTKEMGKGDDAYTIVLPGLEGAISESIAGMVGYSLLAFRKEEVAPDGTPITKYFLRTEGDAAHDFLGTRTAGRLPTIIEPHMKTIYDAVMAGRPTPPATPPAPLPAPPAAAAPPAESVAQSPGQPAEVQTPVQTTPAEQPAAPAAPAETPPAEKPDNEEPITPAAMGHVKRVYDAIEKPFPTDIIEKLTMGQARQIVMVWKAAIADHQEGKAAEGSTPVTTTIDYLQGQGWLSDAAPVEKVEVVPKVDGTIAEIKAYVGSPPDLAKVQEAYDVEKAKGDQARVSLMSTLEKLGAKDELPPLQTDVQSPEAPVTQDEPAADTPSTGDTKAEAEAARDAEAQKVVEEKLGAEVIEEGVNADTPCAVCGGKLDDLDLAELGFKRFNKMLCVEDYLAELKKPKE